MDYRDWHVGMKVVCVDDEPPEHGGSCREGAVYTIAAINAVSFPVVCVQLKEMSYRWYEWARASRFRPVQACKTDISIFTALLTKAPTPEKEPA